MTKQTRITYLFDPLCGWCYGASATLENLIREPDMDIELAPTGLFAGTGARPMDAGFADYAWSNDQRIARLTGQPFSDAYRQNVLKDHTRLFDSGPATLAVIAVAITAPERAFEALKAIQHARYVEGRDTTDVTVLAQVLRTLDMPEIADRLATPDAALMAAYRSRVETARTEMRRLGAEGVPALIVGAGDSRRLVRASALFGSTDMLVAELKAA
ncbi:MAG: protein-disulfide isomerase [Rhizobiales bacterium 24-66-13]|nr:MAG: protein-disulfide isomerase [Rhizobiales bacterium 12-68-15]OYZ73908.1 MAG: protein-disulfide isomerase [Rhizobiales bacterium 24-66-13]OZB11285.1 MAG: protein-disulfide isomerase [Rhizobiales bacterium 39-66-18]